jgi:uncharacterized protein YndB with AHSA1/START domain
MSVIKKQTKVHAEPAVVWRKLTTKEGLNQFFSYKTDIDLREGGKATFYVNPNFSYEATFKEIVPNEKLVWVEEGTTVEWTLTSENGGKETVIKMVSSGFSSFGDLNEGVVWGWETCLRSLKWAIEDGFDRHMSPYFGIRGGLIGMGFQIYDVLPGSPAEKAGIKQGDRIQGMGEHSACGISWFADVTHYYKPGQTVVCRVVRKGDWQPEKVDVTLGEWYLEMGEDDIC